MSPGQRESMDEAMFKDSTDQNRHFRESEAAEEEEEKDFNFVGSKKKQAVNVDLQELLDRTHNSESADQSRVLESKGFE